MTLKKFLMVAFVAAVLVACGDDSSSNSVTSSETKSCVVGKDKNCFEDGRDGQTYRTVKIGTQIWMAENLNYESVNSFCYDDDKSNCSKYGRLYTWAAAMVVCPEGWHLPLMAEIEMLFAAVGGEATAGKVLKATDGWYNSEKGTDDYSFTALPTGYRDFIGNYHEGDVNLWSSTEYDNSLAYIMNLYGDGDNAHILYQDKGNGYSVRCVKD